MNLSSKFWRAIQGVAAFIGLVLLCIPAFAQGTTGSISGVVTDQTGGVIAGATVTVTSVQQGTTRTLTTDRSGSYFAPNLIPGTYIVRAQAKNFRPLVRQNVTVEVGGAVKVDMTLQPGAATQTITVTSSVPVIQTTNAQLGGTIQNTIIASLPLNGRNFTNLLTLRPGVTIYPGGSGWTQSSNGIRPHDNVYYVDGVNSNDPWMAQSMMNAVMAAGDAGTILPVDAIDTFRTIQNPQAEYGWKPGSVINVGIKSGTNAYHGTAYAYGRSGNWDASNFFNPGVTTPLQLEQFGATFGGPIMKDKLFFFTTFEEQRYTVGFPALQGRPITGGSQANDPTVGLLGACQAAADNGTLTALSEQIAGITLGPAVTGHPNGVCTPGGAYPGLFPVNDSGSTSVVSNLNGNNRIDSGLAKIDYHVNDKNILSGMFFISPGNGTLVDDPTLQVSSQWQTLQHAQSQVGSVSWTYTPNSNWVNELRVGYSHYYQTFYSADHTNNPANYSYNGNTFNIPTGQTNPQYFGLPEIGFHGSGMAFYMGLLWPKIVGPDAVTQISDHMSYLHGNHTFMFGFDYLNNLSTNNVTNWTKGRVQFRDTSTSSGDMLQNFFGGIAHDARFGDGNFLRHMYSQNIGLFLQDSWRVKPRLMVNLGVRYEVDGVMHEANDLMGNFLPNGGMVQVGNGITSPYNGDHNNFAPRVGFAWDINGNGKTVLRGGAGIMYEQFSFDAFNGIGNFVGLRTIPTGVQLYVNGNQVPNIGGNIAVQFFNGGHPDNGYVQAVDQNWQNGTALFNGPTQVPACGDGVSVSTLAVAPSPCEIMGVQQNIRNPYVETWTLDFQRAITNNLTIDVGYLGNHGVKLLGVTNLNSPPVGAGWNTADPQQGGLTDLQACLASASDSGPNAGPYDNCAPSSALEQAAAPYNSKYPYLGYIDFMQNYGVSSYNALQVTLTQRTSHGLSFIAGYTYGHALDMSSDNWGSGLVAPINNNDPRSLYGNSMFDIRNRFTLSTTYNLPGIKTPGQILQGWSIDSIVTVQSSEPWGVNDYTTDFSGTGNQGASITNGETWNFFGNPADFAQTRAWLNTNGGLFQSNGGGGIPYFPGNVPDGNNDGGYVVNPNLPAACVSNASTGPEMASLVDLGCYMYKGAVLDPAAYGSVGNLGRNTFKGFPFYNWDLSITKTFKISERFSAAFRADFFNVLNHPNISNVFGGPGGDNTYTDPTAAAGAQFGLRPQTPDVANSNSVLGSGGPRAIQLGLKLTF